MIAAAAVLAGVLVAAAAYVAAGTSGLLVVTVPAAVLALVAARLGIPRAVTGRRRPGPAGRVNAAFSSYRRIETALHEAQVSGQRFDLVTRLLLIRLLAALLADRRRVDLARNPGAARQAVGDDVWPLLDPARPPVTGPAAPGVTVTALTTMTERLEGL